MFRKIPVLITLFLLSAAMSIAQQVSARQKSAKRAPIIDMHIHADTMEDFGGGNLSICLGDGKLTLPAVDPKSNFKMQDLVDCEKTLKSAGSDALLKLETIAE